MLIDVKKFVEKERPFWDELDTVIKRYEYGNGNDTTIKEIMRLQYLYKRTCDDLVRLRANGASGSMLSFVEELVARSFRVIHHTKKRKGKLKPLLWFFVTFPSVFRKQGKSFLFSVLVVLMGAIFGAGLLMVDKDARTIFLPPHLHPSPSERVQKEEASTYKHIDEGKTSFAAQLMTHNIKVTLAAFAFGITFGIGTFVFMFYNGVILGAVIYDYIVGGEAVFLVGWLLPHGSIEIPAMLIAGQAGFVLGSAVIGYGSDLSLSERLRSVRSDVITLVCGVAIFLVWAGIIEAFLSQYHAPVITYTMKITFGVIEVILLILFLGFSGRGKIEKVA